VNRPVTAFVASDISDATAAGSSGEPGNASNGTSAFASSGMPCCSPKARASLAAMRMSSR
jgi:hypothetical protein